MAMGWYGVLDRQNQQVANPNYGARDVKAWCVLYILHGAQYTVPGPLQRTNAPKAHYAPTVLMASR